MTILSDRPEPFGKPNHLTRRQMMASSAAALAGTAIVSSTQSTLAAAHTANNSITTASGTIDITPISHASLILSGLGLTIYVDPVGDVAAYQDMPPADLILVTHEHQDHFSTDVLNTLSGESVPMITNPAVHGMLSGRLQENAVSIANGAFTQFGDIRIDAIPAYNTTADRLNYHPEGRDNGYVLTIDGTRIYIAGDTEDIPEMRALTDIDLAFVPMNLPFTMDVNAAADGVLAFVPKVVYPYHYRGSETEEFKRLVDEGGKDIEVRLHDWYAA